MIQDDNPASADNGQENPTPENVSAPPAPPADSKLNRRIEAGTPDPFAVGVRVLRMAPAWLLGMTVGCTTLVLLLGWINAGGAATLVAQPSALNDARASRAVPAADAARQAALARSSDATPPAKSPVNAAPAPDDNTAAQAAVRPAPTTPTAGQPAATQPAVIAQAASPARGDDSAKFTVQVGSFSNLSEANEHVSGLRGAGFESRAVSVEIQGRGTWYRVQVGRFADRGEAAKAVASLRAKGAAADAIIVPVQN